MNIQKFVGTRLVAFRDRTGMWGSHEAVELQAIQLLEVEARLIDDDALTQTPRLIIDFYVDELRLRFGGLDARPLHDIFEPSDTAFGQALYDACTAVRVRVRQLLAAHGAMSDDLNELRSAVLIDGAWDLDDLSDFPKHYSQVYYFLYLARHKFATADPDHLARVFASYRWKGGYVYATFFRELAKLVPALHRPEIESIKYSSPGFIKLKLSHSTATALGQAIEQFLSAGEKLVRAAKLALDRNRYCNRELSAERTLSPADLQSLYETTSQFASLLGFVDFDLLLANTGEDVVIASNIILAYYRRLEDLAHYRTEQKATFL